MFDERISKTKINILQFCHFHKIKISFQNITFEYEKQQISSIDKRFMSFHRLLGITDTDV